MPKRTKAYSFDVPWPVTSNRRTTSRGGVACISHRAKVWRAAASLAIRSDFRGEKTITEPCSALLFAHPPDRRRRDESNIEKELFDAFERARVVANDYLIAAHATVRCEPRKGGLVQVLLVPGVVPAGALERLWLGLPDIEHRPA